LINLRMHKIYKSVSDPPKRSINRASNVAVIEHQRMLICDTDLSKIWPYSLTNR